VDMSFVTPVAVTTKVSKNSDTNVSAGRATEKNMRVYVFDYCLHQSKANLFEWLNS